MRWRPDAKLKQDDLRERKGFLFLPKTIAGETRWLEFARWAEVYTNESPSRAIGYYWKPVCWRNP